MKLKRSTKDLIVALTPTFLVLVIGLGLAYKYVDPAPPSHFVISTGDGTGNYQAYGKMYRDFIKAEGAVDVEVRPSKGAWDNLKSLEDPKSDVEVGFVQDGLGSREKYPKLSSLGSMFYEPIWVFYRGKNDLTRFSQLIGKRIAMGEKGGETHTMAKKLLAASGVTENTARLMDMDADDEVKAIKEGSVDVAFFIATPDNPLVSNLLNEKDLKLMSLDQAEATCRKFPYLHHLILPHGTINLEHNIPNHDVDLVSPTATLVVRNSLHPALVYLLLKAAHKVHGPPGIFEARHEFPIDKDYVFPLNAGANNFYRSGAPFWLRYLPFWLATIVERFIFLIIPMVAIILPIIRMVPRYLQWRIKSRIYQRYGELKHLESQIRPEWAQSKYQDYLDQLDKIEERVNSMRVPLDFSDYVYSLRGHIHFVRERLNRLLIKSERLKA